MDKNKNKLHPAAFIPLGAGRMRPEGWLLNQLRAQADSLSGHLDEFWPDIQHSRWFGGSAEGWERAPYWLDGVIPLAWMLEDENLQMRIHRYVNLILSLQQSDGWLCPGSPDERDGTDVWAVFLVLKMLVEYHTVTSDDRIEVCVEKALRALDRHIDRHTLFNWAKTRWFECLIPLWWLYERRPDAWLAHLAQKLCSQGFDWFSFFERWPYEQPDEFGRWSQMSHGVNNAMMLKAGALWSRLTGDLRHDAFADFALDLLDKWHGMITGVFTADECLSGKNPAQGTELCAIVEMMYSLEQLIAVTGRLDYADRLEKIAFNALPATLSSDMWTHQYDQQVNQIRAAIQNPPIFRTNGPDSAIFGLEPHFGCCTANFSQGWSKYAASLLLQDDEGLTVAGYAPCRADTELQGVQVRLRINTEYPFDNTVTLHLETSSPIRFPLRLRKPAFCTGFDIHCENAEVQQSKNSVTLLTDWHVNTVRIQMSYLPKLTPRPNGMGCVEWGPLIFALPIEEQWREIPSEDPVKQFPHCDYEVLPKSDWRFGLTEDAVSPDGIKPERLTLASPVFTPNKPPLILKARGCTLPDWREERSAAAWPAENVHAGEFRTITLIPYGCTHLRIAEFPIIKEDDTP